MTTFDISRADRRPIDLFHDQEHRTRLDCSANPHLTLQVHRIGAALYFDVSDFGGHPHVRVSDTIGYLRHLHAVGSAADPRMAEDQPPFIFQADDNPHHFSSVSWERKLGWDTIRLVPDLYYYQARGYSDFMVDAVPTWLERKKAVVWRGSSTGILGLTIEKLDLLPRYRLCRAAASLASRADVGLSAVVQAPSTEQHDELTARVTRENIIKPFISMEEMSHFQYVVDIDGNANSWNLLQKMRLGCCLMKVESCYEQWIYPRLKPWVHFIPLAGDLSDFAEKMDWAMENESQSEAIAEAGRDFALEVDFSSEMLTAAKTVFLAHTRAD